MRYLLLIPLMFCVNLAHSQKDTTTAIREIELPEVVVTGTGSQHYLKNAPVQTEVISGKALHHYSGKSIEEILGMLSASFSFNGSDMGSSMQLNGLGNNYILILIDGRKINGDIGGQNDLNTINISTIERIEIVKGASSSLYGSDAIAGVINFITKKNSDNIAFSNITRIGSYSDILQNNTIGFRAGRWNSMTAVNYKHTDGWQNTTEEWYHHALHNNSTTRTVNPSDHYKISENLTCQLTDRLILSGDISFYQRWTRRPSGFPQWNLKDYYYRDRNYVFGADYTLFEKDKLSFDASYGEYNYYYDYTKREYMDFFDKERVRVVYFPGDRILQSSQRRLLSRLKGLFYIGDNHILNVGTEYNREMLISPHRLVGGDRASAYTISLYAQDEWSITPSFNVTAGMRFVYHNSFGKTATPKISAMYKFGDFNLRLTYSYGFKAPTVRELYYSNIATIMNKLKAYYGNDSLKPQVSNYYAAGLEYHTNMLKMSLTTYYNQVFNMISLQPIPTSPQDKLLEVEETLRYANLAKARTYGADFTFSLSLTPDFSIGGGYSYVNAKAQDPEQINFRQYQYINGTSLHNATFRGTWEHTWQRYRLGVSIFSRYQSKRYYLNDGDANGYQNWRVNTVHSLLGSERWKLDLHIGVDNIFNYIDKTPFGRNRGTNTPGRTFYISCSISFQNRKEAKHERRTVERTAKDMEESDSE